MSRSLLLIAAATLVSTAAALQASSPAAAPIAVTLTVEQPEGPFLHHQDVKVTWQVTSGTFDPVWDYVSAWWLPFKASYTEFYNVTGNQGSATFNLLNARAGYDFKYYRNNTLIATSAVVVMPEGSYPMQIHTEFPPQHPDRAWVIWTSNRTSGNEVVWYGQDKDNLKHTAYAMKSTTYTQQQMNSKVQLPKIEIRDKPFDNLGARALRCVWGVCYNDFTASELFVDPGFIHVAELTDVAPGTQYYFMAGESTPGAWMSDVKSFHSRIAAGADQSIQLVYVADAGAGRTEGGYQGSASHNESPPPGSDPQEGARYVWDAIKRDPLHTSDQASIMNGDISYARGWPWIWELFHNQTEDIFTPAPVMATYGNHEFDYGENPFNLCNGGDSGGEAGIPTAIRFNFESDSQPWYHLAQGPVHFIAMSSEHSVSEQSYWLKSEVFPKVNRSLTPWVVAFFHRPYHMSNTWLDQSLASRMEDGYSDLFARNGVDLVLTGHAHYYERMCAINSGACATYNYRPVWSTYNNVVLGGDQMKTCVSAAPTQGLAEWHHGPSKLDSCKQICMNATNCTGTFVSNSTCFLLTCALPLQLDPAPGGVRAPPLLALERMEGRPPVYILDGTAGGLHVPNSTPFNIITEYKDFDHWGYSRLNANGTALHWRHYHIDGSLVDETTMKPWNAGM